MAPPAPATRQTDPIEAYDLAHDLGDQTPEELGPAPGETDPAAGNNPDFATPELVSPHPCPDEPIDWDDFETNFVTPEPVSSDPRQDEPIDWNRIERSMAELPVLDQDQPIEIDQIDLSPEPISFNPCRYLSLSPELQHAQSLPAFDTAAFTGRNILIENTADEPVGLVFERYRSLLRSFLIATETVYDKELTEQWGADVWRKLWLSPRTRKGPRASSQRTFLHLKTAKFLVLWLDPRTELRFKVAREAFHREPIDYDNLLGCVLQDRMFRNLPTWVFTPCRVSDPDFIAVYGEAFAHLITTSFNPVQFRPPQPDRAPVHHNPPLCQDAQSAQTPPPIFLDPVTGETFNPETGHRERPKSIPARERKTSNLVRTTYPQYASPSDDVPSPYAAKMRAIWEQKMRRLGIAAEPVRRAIPAPPATTRPARLVHCDEQLPQGEAPPLMFPGEPPGM